MNKDTVMAIVVTAALCMPALARAQNSPGANASGAPQVEQPAEGGVNWGGVGYGAATVLADAVYIPVKLVYATVGGITGGFAYGLTGGNSQAADTIWRSSLGGDYVLTPKMLRGEEPIYFSGPTSTPPAAGAPANVAGSSANMGGAASSPIDNGAGSVSRSPEPPPAGNIE